MEEENSVKVKGVTSSREKKIGEKTIEFGTITTIMSVQDLEIENSDARDKIISRFQNSKQGMLAQLRKGASNAVEEVEKGLEISTKIRPTENK